MKILIAVDGSKCSDAAISEVLKRPWPANTEVRAITAFEVPVMVGIEPWAATPNYFNQLERAIRDGAQATVNAALEKLNAIASESLRVSGQAIEGTPGQAVVDEAERWGADLIVMGSRGLGTWNRLLLGSVSSNVVHHAKCSVEVVRDNLN